MWLWAPREAFPGARPEAFKTDSPMIQFEIMSESPRTIPGGTSLETQDYFQATVTHGIGYFLIVWMPFRLQEALSQGPGLRDFNMYSTLIKFRISCEGLSAGHHATLLAKF